MKNLLIPHGLVWLAWVLPSWAPAQVIAPSQAVTEKNVFSGQASPARPSEAPVYDEPAFRFVRIEQAMVQQAGEGLRYRVHFGVDARQVRAVQGCRITVSGALVDPKTYQVSGPAFSFEARFVEAQSEVRFACTDLAGRPLEEGLGLSVAVRPGGRALPPVTERSQ